MNEIPIKQFQNIKGLSKDTICDMCDLNESQTTLHVVSRCTKILADKKIKADRQLIIEKTKKLSDIPALTVDTTLADTQSTLADTSRHTVDPSRHTVDTG